MAGQNEPGPVCLYKDGEAKTFDSSEIDIMLGQGWLDHPETDTPATEVPETVITPAVVEEMPKPVQTPMDNPPDAED